MYALTAHQLQVERERDIEISSVMRSPHNQLQVERRESHRDDQVYALTTHQLQVERRESLETIKCMRSPHTAATGGEERES